MTSNTKAAESVQVAPYLTHVVSHHGRITLIPPENAGRTRKTSKLQGKKEKKSSRKPRERSVRSEDSEEARFNLGTPRSARSLASATSTRRRPPRNTDENRSRGREADGYGEDINIPDYPPPTFQEAISGSAPSFIPTLPIQPAIAADAASSNTVRLSPTPSPTTDPSPMVSQRPSLRLLSIIAEPSTSLPPSPAPLTSSLPSPSSSTSPQTFSNPHSRSISPLPQTPQSPGSDSDSDSQEYVRLPPDPPKRQWEEDRQLGLPFEERVQREQKRLLARQVDGTPAGNDAHAQLQSSTQAGLSRCTSQEALGPDRAPSARKGRPTLQVPHPDWRLTLDEPSLRSMTSTPCLATQFSQKARSPLSPLRPPWPAISRPYHSAGATSSTLSLSLGHLRLPGSFGKSTTFLGASSAQTGGRESTGSRRLFSKGKGKEKDKSLSDGDLDDGEEEEEALDSWQVIEQPAIGEPGPSTRVRPSRPRLTLKPPLKAFDISTSPYEERAVGGKRENDTRVDPFPISAEPASSPETERPSSISPTPTNFYPPPAPFSSSTPTPTITSSLHPPARVLDQDLESRRQRCGSMRTRPAPPPPSEFLNKQVHRPAPPPPPVRTGFIRATPPYSPTSPSLPSPLSGIPAPVVPPHALQTSCTVPVLTPTPIQGPANRRRTPPPPPPPPQTAMVPNVNRAAESYDRALEVPLPPTPSDPSSVRPWIPILSGEKDREIQREVRRRYGYAPGPHLYSNASSTYTQPPAPAPNDYPITARTGPAVDYTHVPAVPSRLAVSIPTYSQSPPLSSRSITSSPATPRGHHFPGRPLPMTPRVASPVAIVGNGLPSSVGIMQNRSHRQHDQIHNHTDVNVPEGLLIDFETDLDSNNRSSGTMGGGDVDGTAAVGENGTDFPISSPGSAVDDERQSVFESAGSSDTSSAASPVVAAPPPPQFSEYTDLDMLLSRMEENHNGTNYDTLLLIQEFVGPAAQNSNDITSTRSPSTLLGKIEIIRRRVLKDGRVKLKLSLLGTMVDKCGICLSQFKESELAALGVACQHAFHEKCLRCWLARSRTCPLCRVPLDITGS